MKPESLKKQFFGDGLEKMLNEKRKQMNDELRERAWEALKKKQG